MASKEKQRKSGSVPKEAAKKSKKAAGHPVVATLIDDVDPKTIRGQFTRGRAFNLSSLGFAAELSDNGIVNLDLVPNVSFPALTPEQTQYIAEKIPIGDIRFSKKATYMTMALGEKIFEQKVEDIHRLNQALAGKQTLSLDAVYAERAYRETANLSNAMMLRQQAPATAVTMLEDAEAAYGSPTDPIPNKAYQQVKKIAERMHYPSDENRMDLAQVANELFPGVDGPWSN